MMENIDSVPSNVQSSRQEALLCVFEDNEAVIKMIIKGRSPTMRHVSRTHRVALDWSFDRINVDPKIQIRYIDPRDEWNHLLCLFNISHFSSTVCSDTMAKRSQQDSGEERVTAKSRLVMNFIARTPSFVSASDQHYHEQFMESFSSTSYSKLDDDLAWCSQEWKTETTTYDRSGRSDKNFLENGKKSST